VPKASVFQQLGLVLLHSLFAHVVPFVTYFIRIDHHFISLPTTLDLQWSFIFATGQGSSLVSPGGAGSDF
jgi:hypothetical protein